MSLALSPKRTALMPGPWVRNDLWRRARAVPSLDLQFAESKSLADAVTGQSLVTFTRASSATYVDSDGLIKTAATNLLLYSEQFDNALWTKSNTTVTADSVTAPDGATTADRLVETNATATFSVYRTATSTPGTYTFSVFAKGDGSGRLLNLTLQNNNGYLQSYFNLSTGVVSNVSGSMTASITAFPNGWYRCSVTSTSTSITYCFAYIAAAAGENSVYVARAGSTSAGLYLWGAQLEAGAFPTSYIPTTTASVTRSADVVSITGAGLLSFFNNQQGTFYAAAATSSSSASANQMIVSAGDGAAAANQITIYRSGASLLSIVSSAGVLQVNQNSGISAASYKFGFGYQANNFGFSVNANTAQTSSSGATPVVVNTLDIGKWHVSSSGYWNSTISRLTYWPQRLSNPTLQAITQ